MPSPHPEAPEVDTVKARPTIGYVARDLFFGVRLAEGIKRLDRPARAITPGASDLSDLALLLVDLTAPEARWLPLIEAAHDAGTPVLAFGSHMDQERWKIARQAGATRIVANSQLVEHFPELIRQVVLTGVAQKGDG